MQTIKTVVHAYQFNIRNAEEAQGYKALREKLKALGLKCFETHGGELHITTGRKLDGKTVQLETDFVFDNQWNTTPIEGLSDKGYRLMDWAQDYRPGNSADLKQGYWLEPTEEMADIRRVTMKCGYCGKSENISLGNTFCSKCLGSPHLDHKTLPLLRLMPASFTGNRPELTEEEKALLMPLYTEAQLKGTGERSTAYKIKQRADLVTERDNVIRKANTKHDGMIALLDLGLSIENVIYYDHVGRFSFGWRSPVEAEVVSAILDVISEFSFPYEIKCKDGRKLEGNIE